MKLLIVESPAKAKTISKYLDGEYEVTSSVGHIRDLPKSNKQAIDMEADFAPRYQIVPGKENVVRELKKSCAEADEVVLATDPDREGEAIAWHIKEVCGLEDPKRVVFHEITQSAIVEAMKHPRAIDEDLRKAQEARRVLDRLFGYDLSGLIWKKVRYGLSAGRVQSPALRIIMEREKEIRAFIPETFWVITAETETPKKEALTLTCAKEPRTQEEKNKIITLGKKGSWAVVEVKETEVKRVARAPFITSTLQQSASTRLGFPPSKTMSLAQKLYEAGYITYMRTDSTTLSKKAQEDMVAYIIKKFGKEYALPKEFKTKSRTAQEAHEAIRPTTITKANAGTTADQKKLYALIWQRALSSQMSDAIMLRTKIVVSPDPEIPDFSATGSRVQFDGWLKVDFGARSEDVELPMVHEKDGLTLKKILSEKKQTEPPTRYTEAGLVKELEKRGIGRPSTYASILKTLVDRSYANRVGRTLYPTDLGDIVNEFLVQNFSHYLSDAFTSELEDDLDKVAEGKKEYAKVLRDFYTPFTKAVASKKDIGKITNLGDAPKDMRCPKCGSAMIIKLSRSGKFISCAKFPECVGARTIEGKEIEGPKETGEICPKCEKGKLIEREGRFGKFVGCNNYPKCKYIKQTTDNQQPTTNIQCPECKKGFMTERHGRFGIFYSCSGYPDCKYAIKAKPTGNLCPMCSSLMMEGTKTIPERCSKKECPMHNPQKLEKLEE